MLKYKKVVGGTRVADNVSGDYSGELYYRKISDVRHVFKRFLVRLDEDRCKRLDKSVEGIRPVLRPGTVVDENGEPLPEWREPLKWRVTVEGPLPLECVFGGWVSERAWAVIQEAEPGRHVFVPVDGIRPDGLVERFYATRWGETYLPNEPPVLLPDQNDVRRFTYGDGRPGFNMPRWMVRYVDQGERFGLLDASVVDGRHLFTSELLNNAPVLSGTLFDRLLELGPIGTKWDIYSPLGVA